MNNLTVKDNLDRARKIGHKVLIKNGHFKRMAAASVAARKKKLSPKKKIAK